MRTREAKVKRIEIGYALSAVGIAFYYVLSTDSVFLPLVYATISFVGSIMLLISTWISTSKETRTKFTVLNIIYIVLINILGILSKYYGGLITFILIITISILYGKFLKKSHPIYEL